MKQEDHDDHQHHDQRRYEDDEDARGSHQQTVITGELKLKVDRIWDTMWSGGISNPLSVIEQLTYLLFIKCLDELHTPKERKAARHRTAPRSPARSLVDRPGRLRANLGISRDDASE
mgnify:CR=1 FL=1